MLYSEILANATRLVIYRRLSDSPLQLWTKVPIIFIRTCVGNVAPLACVGKSLRIPVSKNSRRFIVFAGFARIEIKTISFPCAYPIISIWIKLTLGIVWLRCDYDVVTLPNSNKHGCAHVRMNGYEISTNDLKPVIIDGKDKG